MGINSVNVTYLKNPPAALASGWAIIAGAPAAPSGKNLKFKRAVVRNRYSTSSSPEVYGIGNVGNVYRRRRGTTWTKITTSPKMDDLEIGSNNAVWELVKMELFIEEIIWEILLQLRLDFNSV